MKHVYLGVQVYTNISWSTCKMCHSILIVFPVNRYRRGGPMVCLPAPNRDKTSVCYLQWMCFITSTTGMYNRNSCRQRETMFAWLYIVHNFPWIYLYYETTNQNFDFIGKCFPWNLSFELPPDSGYLI